MCSSGKFQAIAHNIFLSRGDEIIFQPWEPSILTKVKFDCLIYRCIGNYDSCCLSPWLVSNSFSPLTKIKNDDCSYSFINNSPFHLKISFLLFWVSFFGNGPLNIYIKTPLGTNIMYLDAEEALYKL